MFAVRNAKITRTKEKVLINTFPVYPPILIICFLTLVIPWFAFGGFVLLSILGYISPDSMTGGIRAFLCIWFLLWLVFSALSIPDMFLVVFATIDIEADAERLSVKKSTLFGSWTRHYCWQDIEYVSEYVIDGRMYGGVMIRTKNRLIKLDGRLPNRMAKTISKAIDHAWPNHLN